MKFRSFLFSLLTLAFIAVIFPSCTNNSNPRTNCMHCTGCFNSWDECKEDYHQDSTHPYTWEQYVDSTIAQNQFSTNHCERAN